MGAMQMYEIGAELVFVVVLMHEMGVVGLFETTTYSMSNGCTKNHFIFYYLNNVVVYLFT